VRVARRTPPARGSAPSLQQSDEEVVLLDAPELDRSQQDQLAAHAVQRTYGPGETIIRQGDEADAFYILSHGHLNVFLEIPAQAPRLLGQLHDGAYFGEIGLLQGVRRTATVKVSEDAGAEVLVIDRATFMRYVAEFDLVGDEIAALVRRRTINLNLAKALPSLTPELIAQVSPALEIQSFAPGDVIIRQGDPAETFYILTRGRAEVLLERPDGRTITVDWREPGEYFGEIGLMRNRPRTATVRAASDGADVLVLDRESFFNLVGSSQATEGAIARSMARQLIHMAGAD
jgi:CRP-like cAMP-binding protein